MNRQARTRTWPPKRAALAAAMALCALAAPAVGEQLQTIDGQRLTGKLVGLTDAKATFQPEKGDTRKLPRDDVQRVIWAEAASLEESSAQAVATVGGGLIAIRQMQVADGHVAFTHPLLGKVGVPLSHVQRIYLPGSAQTLAALRKDLPEPREEAATRDVLLIRQRSGRLTPLSGVLSGADAKEVAFRWREEQRAVPRENVVAVVMAPAGAAEVDPVARLIGPAGDRVPLSAVRVEDGKVLATTTWGQELRLAVKAVAALELLSDRLTPLTELKPAETRHVPLFRLAFPPQVNRSTLGQAMRLDGEEIAEGLGVHSFTELTYDLDGQYKTFLAQVGIDDAVRPAGKAGVVILGDGEPIGEPLVVEGSKDSQTLRVDVSGVKKMTLRVEYGPDGLDSGDHVNFASPRLIK